MNNVNEIIREYLKTLDPLPFNCFMDAALYHREFGYYEKSSNQVGKGGDFYTSVSVGSVFGELLGFQFAEWIANSPHFTDGRKFQLTEAGAHDGRLAADILKYFRDYRPELYARLQLCLFEISSTRRQWQEQTLKEFSDKVSWVTDWSYFPQERPDGIFYCNELFDAFEVNRIAWDARKQEWFEWGVTLKDDKFVWAPILQPSCQVDEESIGLNLQELPPELLAVLPHHFTTEIRYYMSTWWKSITCPLGSGWWVSIDYGLTAEEFFLPQRANGTLRAYRNHRVSDDVLADPGEQDITAHVNFTALQKSGEAAGLSDSKLCSQASFLVGIASAIEQKPHLFPAWTSERIRQFQSLTHPEHLGRPFKVLTQSRFKD